MQHLTLGGHKVTVGRTLSSAFVVASLVSLVACGTSKREAATPASVSASAAQALRTCVDRWNEGNMRSWGPALASIGVRRLDADRLASVGLPPGPPRRVVTLSPGDRLR